MVKIQPRNQAQRPPPERKTKTGTPVSTGHRQVSPKMAKTVKRRNQQSKWLLPGLPLLPPPQGCGHFLQGASSAKPQHPPSALGWRGRHQGWRWSCVHVNTCGPAPGNGAASTATQGMGLLPSTEGQHDHACLFKQLRTLPLNPGPFPGMSRIVTQVSELRWDKLGLLLSCHLANL